MLLYCDGICIHVCICFSIIIKDPTGFSYKNCPALPLLGCLRALSSRHLTQNSLALVMCLFVFRF